MNERIVAHAEMRDYGRRVALFLGSRETGTERLTHVAAPLVFEPLGEGELADGPTMLLRVDEAQQLVDALHRAGLRPTDDPRDPSATVRHLEDMRALVFAKLGVEKP